MARAREERLAECQDCGEPFVWVWIDRSDMGPSYEMTAPRNCRACQAIEAAEKHERAAHHMRYKVADERARARANAVERFRRRLKIDA